LIFLLLIRMRGFKHPCEGKPGKEQSTKEDLPMSSRHAFGVSAQVMKTARPEVIGRSIQLPRRAMGIVREGGVFFFLQLVSRPMNRAPVMAKAIRQPAFLILEHVFCLGPDLRGRIARFAGYFFASLVGSVA
jgi:hypothetical protein